MDEIDLIRAVWGHGYSIDPAGTKTIAIEGYNSTVRLAQEHIATLLAALDAAQARARALGADKRRLRKSLRALRAILQSTDSSYDLDARREELHEILSDALAGDGGAA